MESRPVQYFEGRKRNSPILHCGDGFHYNIREIRPLRIRLQCRHYKSGGRGCHATASVSRITGMLKHIHPHTHGPDHHLRHDFALRRSMVQEARTNISGKIIRAIIDECRLRLQNPGLAMRFTRARMCSALYAARSENYPSIPKTLIFLGVLLGSPDLRALCKTSDGADYLFQGVIGCLQQRTIAVVFVSGRMLQFLQSRESIHVDGTFRKRPKKPRINQIFNIVVKHGDNVIGVVRVLMPSRTTAAYTEVFSFLKLIAPHLKPRRVHCDFERAQINAFRLAFPLCRVVGCLWHYSVCVTKKARSLGLSQLANENPLVFSFISCLSAAPLLPRHCLWRGVLEIWGEITLSGWDTAFRPLFEYMEEEWKPRIAELCVFGDPDRTNNCSESGNRMLANAVPQNFPNIWILIGGFVKLEYIAWCDKLAIDNLQQVAPARRVSPVANDRKVRMASQLLRNGDVTPGEFLHSVSFAVRSAALYGLHIGDESEYEDSDSE